MKINHDLNTKSDENLMFPWDAWTEQKSGLTGLYILSKIKTVSKNQSDVGLYRNDDLGIL